MARLRKGIAYRSLERPYTRYSRFKKKSYIKANPSNKIAKFDMGNLRDDFDYEVNMIAKEGLQVRHDAMEAARATCNRFLERNVGKQNYHLKIRKFPHHILRENPLAKGAGADRFSTGMSKAFGNPIGRAAQIKPGEIFFTVYTNEPNLAKAKRALKKATYKMAAKWTIQIENK